MSKFSMSDSKITHNKKTGRVSLSFYSHTDDDELDLLLSLLGAYNTHGRKFEIEGFHEVKEEFEELLEKCYGLLLTAEEKATQDRADFIHAFNNRLLDV